ncbi:MAG: DUF2891 domain-containing protein, partial [Candidatus Didemnitutus sp.]|nr:DUF2891 domain-containing protein [Candidatus Didemnitutus sp.]
MPASLPALTPLQASAFAVLALDNVRREYPRAELNLLNGPGDVRPPRELHPAFYGCYDWHSCVHQHWMMVRLLRLFPRLPERAAMEGVLREHLSADHLRVEAAYLSAPGRSSFQRPYGWVWVLKLEQELRAHDPEFAQNLHPLVAVIREGLVRYLRSLTYPMRHGSHANTAFATAFALNWARSVGDQELKLLCTSRAAAWFGRDKDYPAHLEPGGEDFFSPALVEAGLMGRILPPMAFAQWFAQFLPHIAQGQPASLLHPATVSTPGDPKIGHLIGLNLNRAWVWRRLVDLLPAGDELIPVCAEASARHFEAALPLLDS